MSEERLPQFQAKAREAEAKLVASQSAEWSRFQDVCLNQTATYLHAILMATDPQMILVAVHQLRAVLNVATSLDSAEDEKRRWSAAIATRLAGIQAEQARRRTAVYSSQGG
jgi:hypothetical protein